MATKTKQDEIPPVPPVEDPQPTDEVVEAEDDGVLAEVPSNWEFIDKVPTRGEVLALLETLRDQWGVTVAEYVDYVVPLPSRKKVKIPTLVNGKTRDVEVYRNVYTLYMGVPGRIAMLNTAAEINNWRVDFDPVGGSPDLPPGFIEMGSTADQHIVYREACVIFDAENSDRILGTKTGTAWVQARGGSQAAGSNPYEKVETSARGRAIAAWGIGVLPGSGVASLEEMLGRPAQDRSQPSEQPQKRKTSAELIDEARLLAETVRQLRGIDEIEMNGRIVDYMGQQFGVDVSDGADGVNWQAIRSGQLPLLIGMLEQTRRKIAGDDSQL